MAAPSDHRSGFRFAAPPEPPAVKPLAHPSGFNWSGGLPDQPAPPSAPEPTQASPAHPAGCSSMDREAYQALIEGKRLDLTYMEYELLKFLASHPGKVFTRETLLSRVWGHDYYGGARTVDVHVRRLRTKLGEEHANLIQTRIG
jgi:DNA-binding response OmpR family regulator